MPSTLTTAQRVLETWNHSVATGDDYDIEARMIRARDGHARWWWLRAQPVRDESGKILHWLGVAIDIDDRKTFAETLQQRQEETERQRAELETIYQTAPIGLALFDPVEFRYLRINDRQAETIGLPREKILGRRITEIAPLKGLRETPRSRSPPAIPSATTFSKANSPPAPASIATGTSATPPSTTPTATSRPSPPSSLRSPPRKRPRLLSSRAKNSPPSAASPAPSLTRSTILSRPSPTSSISSTCPTNSPRASADYVHTAQSELSRVCQIATQTLRFHRQAVRATHVSAADLVDAVLNLYQGRLANSSIQVEASLRLRDHGPLL